MMNSEQLRRAEENSALFDGENLPKQLELTDEDKAQMESWSLIGAALRNDLPKEVNLSFASKIMDTIESEKIVPDEAVIDQADVKMSAYQTIRMNLKKFGFGLVQVALAASVAAVTVVGWQVMSIDDSLNEPTASTTLGTVNNVSLASYSRKKSESGVNLVSDKKDEKATDRQMPQNMSSEAIAKQQHMEVERINGYLKGYIFDTASK